MAAVSGSFRTSYPYQPGEYVPTYYSSVFDDAVQFARYAVADGERSEYAYDNLIIGCPPGNGLAWLLQTLTDHLDGSDTAEAQPRQIYAIYWSFSQSRPTKNNWEYAEKAFCALLEPLYDRYNAAHPHAPLLFDQNAKPKRQIQTLVEKAKADARFVLVCDDLDHFTDKGYNTFKQDVIDTFRAAAGFPNHSFRAVIGFHQGVALGLGGAMQRALPYPPPNDALRLQLQRLMGDVTDAPAILDALKQRHHLYTFNNLRINRYLLEWQRHNLGAANPLTPREMLIRLLADREIRAPGASIDPFYQKCVDALLARVDAPEDPIIQPADWSSWTEIPTYLADPRFVHKSSYFLRVPPGVNHKLHPDFCNLLRDCRALETTPGGRK